MRFGTFDADEIKVAIALAIRSTRFPDITEEWLREALEWVSSVDGRKFMLEMRERWADRDTPEEPEELEEPEEPVVYATKFHHTQTEPNGPDGGTSLVLCPGQEKFERCEVDGRNLRYHGTDEGRHLYWGMKEKARGPIRCYKDGNEYVFRTDGNAPKGMVFGKCS